MEYTVQKLAALAGVSTRTLRYYDQLGILKPARINSSGYRIYGRTEVDRLQQILFYRELGVSLEQIRELMQSHLFDGVSALKEHHAQLMEKRSQLDRLISNVERTLAAAEGSVEMSDKDKFEGFKKEMVNENERKYGEEVRGMYGDETVDRSNKKVMGMTKEQHDRAQALEEEMLDTLVRAMETGNPFGELARKAVLLHKEWLCLWVDRYTPEYHAGLGRMYVEDERFRKHYDDRKAGASAFLRDAILAYV